MLFTETSISIYIATCADKVSIPRLFLASFAALARENHLTPSERSSAYTLSAFRSILRAHRIIGPPLAANDRSLMHFRQTYVFKDVYSGLLATRVIREQF